MAGNVELNLRGMSPVELEETALKFLKDFEQAVDEESESLLQARPNVTSKECFDACTEEQKTEFVAWYLLVTEASQTKTQLHYLKSIIHALTRKAMGLDK